MLSCMNFGSRTSIEIEKINLEWFGFSQELKNSAAANGAVNMNDIVKGEMENMKVKLVGRIGTDMNDFQKYISSKAMNVNQKMAKSMMRVMTMAGNDAINLMTGVISQYGAMDRKAAAEQTSKNSQFIN